MFETLSFVQEAWIDPLQMLQRMVLSLQFQDQQGQDLSEPGLCMRENT